MPVAFRVLILALALSAGAFGSSYEFLKIDNVMGESTVAGHVGEIDVISSSNGWNQGSAGLSFVAKPGRHTPKLVQAALSGQSLGTAVYTMCPLTSTGIPWLQWRFTYTNVKLVGMQHATDPSSGGTADSYSFTYDTVRVEYFAASSTTSTASASWNLLSAHVL